MSFPVNLQSRGRNALQVGALLTFALSALGAAAVAGATTPTAPRFVVDYRDLNLGDPQDVAVLYRRIVAASKRVCPDGELVNLHVLQLVQQCRREAVARAVGSIGNPRLNAMLSQKLPVS